VTLARKGTRHITVDEVGYRWKVLNKTTELPGIGWSPLTFVVEHADTPGARLVVSLPDANPASWVDFPERWPGSVHPRTVAHAIRRALAQGWEPSRRGPQFLLTHPGDERP
jgi:hypothetical protein